jgi:hypothetical protein
VNPKHRSRGAWLHLGSKEFGLRVLHSLEFLKPAGNRGENGPEKKGLHREEGE